MEKARILWISDAVIPTGFSRVAHSIIKNFAKDKYDIYWLGINYYGDPHPYKDLKIFPAAIRGDVYGIKRIAEFSNIDFDLIFILNDAWVQSVYLNAIKKAWKDKKLPKIITYTPVDAIGHDQEWYKDFDIVTIPVAYTEFGEITLRRINPRFDVRVIYHGTDRDKFYKLNKDKKEIKKEFYPDESYADSFIILNANRNQPRKRLDVSLQGFSLFAQNKPENVKFYYHGGVTDSAVNVATLAKRYGIENRLIVTNLEHGPQHVSDEKLNLIYNATDVGLNTSLGEGWGLVNIEHSMTGAPQIVPNHSACRELYQDCGILLPVRQQLVLDNINTEGGLVSPEDVASALEHLYTNKELYDSLSNAGLNKFLADEYNWVNISKQWESLFDEVLNADNLAQ